VNELAGVVTTIGIWYCVAVAILATLAFVVRLHRAWTERRVRRLLARTGMSDPGLDRLMRDVFDRQTPPRLEIAPPAPERFRTTHRGGHRASR
jgi:hypothetical protein